MASSSTPPATTSSTTTTAQAAPLTGSCLCGQITWAVRGGVEPLANVICYCENCQKQTGSHMLNSSVYPVDAFTITSATAPKCYLDTNVASGTPLQRFFCGDCGSLIYGASLGERGKGFISVGAGTVDRVQPGGGRPAWEWTPNMVVRGEERPRWLEGLTVVEKNKLEGTAE